MNVAIKGGSDSRSYKRDCAYCLLQGTPNEPPSPAPRKAAITRKASVSSEALAFRFRGPCYAPVIPAKPGIQYAQD